MGKRSFNFQGSAATVHRKVMQPGHLLAALRKLGMSDDEIRAFFERAKKDEEVRRLAAQGKG